ncbi:MAG TPA: TraR/DksA C4-type zinc finger protein [Candidatus Nanopelagicales bacterium]
MTTTAALSTEELAELRSLLQQVRAENEADLERARATLADLSANGLLTEPSMREVSMGAEYLIDDATGIIARVDAALARMDAGQFGTCTSCGQQIPLGRLRLRPYQPTCVACSS